MRYLQNELTKKGWKVTLNEQHFGIYFDLIGFKKIFTIAKWNVLIRKIEIFDKNAMTEWEINFKILSDESKSYLWGRGFVLCLIINKISPEINDNIEILSDSFGAFRVKGGGGTILIANKENKEVIGYVPKIPMDVRICTKLMKELLQNSFDELE